MKLHLPKLLLTAVLTACVTMATANAATFSVTKGADDYLHSCTFTNEHTEDEVGYQSVAVASNGSGSAHIMHFTSTSGGNGSTELKVKYNDFGIAGVDVESDATIAGITYDGNRTFYIGNPALAESISDIDRNFKFTASTGIKLFGTQTWDVAEGATFAFAGSNITNNGNITIKGDGVVDFSGKTVSGAGSITVSDGTLSNATFSNGSTIGLRTDGKLSNVTLSDGANVSLATVSGIMSSSVSFDFSGYENVSVGSSIGLYIYGKRFESASSYENSVLSFTVSEKYYSVSEKDTMTMNEVSTAIGEETVTGILVGGTISKVDGTNLNKSIYGNGTVQIAPTSSTTAMNADALTTKLSKLDDFVGTVELMEGAKLHFGNNDELLSNVEKIKINSGGYVTGWGSGKTFEHAIQLNGGRIAVHGATWSGSIAVTKDSEIGMYANSTLSGAMTATAGTTLSVKKETVIGTGGDNTVLTLNGVAGKLDGGTLDIQHGTVKISGHNGGNAMIAGAIKVGAGAKLQVAGSDTLGYAGGNYTDSITAAGSKDKLAVIQLDANQTMSANLYLNGYTEINGSSFNSFGKSDEVEDATTVSASGTNNTIKSNFNLRRHVIFTVAEDGSLTMEGTLTDTANFNGSLIKEGKGALNFTGTLNSTHAFTVKEGAINLSGATNSMGTLDLSVDDSSDAVLTVKKDAVLTVGTLWGCSTSSLLLEEGATLKLSSGVINIKGTGSTSGISATNNVSYSHDQKAMSFDNSEVTVNSGEAITLGNVFAGSSLINANGGKVTLTNEDNNLKSIDAKSGNIVVNNYNAGKKQGTLDSLSIGDGKSVSVYTGETASEDAEGTLTTKALTAGTGATLNANLVLSDGATVKLAEALTMGSTVRLGTGMTLSGDLVSTIKGMSEDGIVDLFTGVDALYLGDSTDASGALDATSGEYLKTYFNFDDQRDYYLGYSGGKVYAGVISVPEPTTATLSLLALAALAARRRRR